MKKINNFILIIVCTLFLTGCFATVAPRPILVKTASYAGTNSNAGIIKTIINDKGEVAYVILNKEAHDNYNMLINRYGSKILPKLNKDDGITILSNNTYQIDAEHFSKFALMAAWYKEGK